MDFKLLTFALLLVLTLSCKEKTDNDTMNNDVETNTENPTNKNTLNGTWELTGFYNYKDNEVVDSFDMNPNFRQLKMYTDTKVMWCKHKAADSSEWFGYGTYDYDGEQLTEVLDFGSSVMEEMIASKKEFVFDINLAKNRFEQIELDDNGNRIYSENYKRVE